jgi:hypothetical protein
MDKLPSNKNLVECVMDRIKKEMPDIDDPFWNDRDSVELHLTEVMKKFFKYEIGQTEIIHDDTIGDVTVIVHKPVLVVRWDFVLGEGSDDKQET